MTQVARGVRLVKKICAKAGCLPVKLAALS